MVQVKGICQHSQNTKNDQSAQTQVAASGRQLTFNDDVFRRPLFVEGGEAGVLTDTHHVLSEVKLLCVEAQQTEPQLPHRLSVLPPQWPTAGLNTDTWLGEYRACICSSFLQKMAKCSQVLSYHQRNTRSSHQPSPRASSVHHKSANENQNFIRTQALSFLSVFLGS